MEVNTIAPRLATVIGVNSHPDDAKRQQPQVAGTTKVPKTFVCLHSNTTEDILFLYLPFNSGIRKVGVHKFGMVLDTSAMTFSRGDAPTRATCDK